MQIITKIALFIVFIFAVGFGIGSTITTPEHAIVYVDEASETYLSPPCVEKRKALLMPQMTFGDMRDLTLEINKTCVNQGGFSQSGRSLSGKFLESVGAISTLESRWRVDGSWRW
ncbi:hypothetical protein [Echinimonas agarilytica]|uniref:Uncharacterized protein n=1 Tax=Echinimonas agarilytica TaxID=1215918 RepID=A0AA42BB67_9GAMM|nr:hypothetical protein [Echinimonas agarilytica]MCM2681536.1 hypothetical protein [Echinimonas agarilytica]